MTKKFPLLIYVGCEARKIPAAGDVLTLGLFPAENIEVCLTRWDEHKHQRKTPQGDGGL